jgi:hypothetical protein
VDQTHSLGWFFQKNVSQAISDDGIQLLTCGHFDLACARWTDQALTELYNLNYAPPDFVPSVEAVRKHYGPPVMNAAQAGKQAEVKRLRVLPDNMGLPQVGVVLDGFVTPRGSIISRDFFIRCSLVEEKLSNEGDKAGFPSTYEVLFFVSASPQHPSPIITFYDNDKQCMCAWRVCVCVQYLACNKEKALPKMVEVREVAVIYHLHHDMFYHMVQDQFYRLLALVPYLRQHPDIHVFLYGWKGNWDGSFGDRFFQLCGISK